MTHTIGYRKMVTQSPFFPHLQLKTLCLVIIFLTACGSPPPAQLQGAVSTQQSVTATNEITSAPSPIVSITTIPQAVTLPAQSTATVTTVSATITSDTLAQQSTTLNSTDTPTPVPEVTPSATPLPTATPTFESLSGKSIDGYVFGKPEELTSIDNTINFELTGWVSGSNEEMIVTGDNFVNTVNIRTGDKQRLFEWDLLTHRRAADPVWVQTTGEAVLTLYNLNSDQNELWLNKPGQGTTSQPTLTNVSQSLIPVGGDAEFVVYDFDTQALVSTSKEVVQVEALPIQAASEATTSLPHHIAQSGDWVAYYNRDDFLLINQKTQETKSVNLVDEQNNPLHIRAWNIQRHVKWSPDGNKLALVLTKGPPPIPFSDLYIYDIATGELQKIETPFSDFIDAVAWTPDNRHVVVSAVVGEAEYQTLDGSIITGNTNALFLVDTMNMENWPLPVLSADTVSNIGDILWSPDKKYLVTRYRFYKGEAPVYRVEIISP